MKLALKGLFALIFVFMLTATILTSREVALWSAWSSYAANPWAVATLYDAYSGFLIFFCYVAWRERSWGARLLWLVLILGLGNIATSFYLLLQLLRLGPEEPASAILSRRPA